MKRDYRLYLSDIIESIEKIEKYMAGLSFEEFTDREMIVDAVVRNVEIIGEASRNIPLQLKKNYPSVPWDRMKSMRNIMAHEYFGVDTQILWTTTKNSLPGLKAMISTILGAIGNDG